MKDLLSIDSFEGLIGASLEMRKVFEDARKIAKTRLPVLLIGEFGTGRQSLARAIHRASGGEGNQFVLLDDYKEKKETSPVDEAIRILFEKEAGSLYVEEIANLSLAEQLKLEELLRSSTANKESNARLIAATSKDLKEMIKSGKFRGDLYYLFFVMKIPPLRERPDDILPLAELFCKRYSQIYGQKSPELHRQTVVEITNHFWPGNVLELENGIKKAVVVSGKGRIMPTDLGLEYVEAGGEIVNFEEAREEFERKFLHIAMARNKGNITRVAREIGVSRPSIYKMIKKYDIEK